MIGMVLFLIFLFSSNVFSDEDCEFYHIYIRNEKIRKTFQILGILFVPLLLIVVIIKLLVILIRSIVESFTDWIKDNWRQARYNVNNKNKEKK